MTRAYVDRRVSDLAGASRAAQIAADHWRLVEPDLLRQGMNAIFRCDDVVLRVSTPNAPAIASVELAELLADEGLRIAPSARDDVVEAAGFSVTAWQHVEPTEEPIDWVAVGSMIHEVHGMEPHRLPAALPQPWAREFPWWDHVGLLAEIEPHIDRDSAIGLRAAIERHRGWDDFVDSADVVVCHGDVHPGNVMMSPDGPVLIDWDLLCLAPRGWDHAPLMTWASRWGGDPGIYRDFAAGYGWTAVGDRHGDAFAELRLVSATLMRWKVALVDQAARPEAERRLAFWRGERNAPMWRAQ